MAEGRVGKGVLQVTFDPSQIEKDARSAVLGPLKRIAGDVALLGVGKKLFDIGSSGLDELKRAQAVTTQTAAQLRLTGAAAGVTSEQINELGQQMEELAGFDDEAARSAANVLLRLNAFKGIDGLKRVESDAADLAVTLANAQGTEADLAGGAELLGKALAQPEKASRLLRATIGGLSDAQQASIKSFEDQGNHAAAQEVILQAVEARVKGTAAAYGQTLPGQVARASEAWKDAKAELVGGFAPAIELGARVTTQFARTISDLPDPIREALGGIVLIGGGIGTLVRPVSDLLNILSRLRGAQQASGAAAGISAAGATADAEAQLADATATGVNTAAHGRLTSVLGKAGVAGAIAVGIGALYEYGQSLNKTTLSTEELQKATQLSATDQAKFFQEVAEASRGPFSGMLDDAIQKLKEMGPVGVGTLQQVRDQLAATGQDTSKYDAALADAKQAQQNLSTATAQGSQILDENSDSTAANEEAQRRLEEALKDQQDARQRQLDSARGVFDAEQALASAEHGVASAQRGVADAGRGVEDAQRRVADAYRSAEDAAERLAEAEEALRKAQQPADAETLGNAELDVSDAHLRVADAQSAVTKAEKDARDARRDGKHSAAEVADLDRKVEEAKNALQRATFAETDAEQALQEVQAKGTDQDQAVIEAKKQVEDATRGVDDANRALADSQRAVSDAQQRVIDAKAAVNDAYITEANAAANLKEKQIELSGGVVGVRTELENQLVAFQNIDKLLSPGSPERAHLDEYIQHLFVLAGIFNPQGPDENIIGDRTPGVLRDSGGPLRPRQPFEKRTGAPELLLPEGTYRAPDVASYVLNPRDTAVLLGGGQRTAPLWQGDAYITNPAPEPASSSIAFELQIIGDRMELVG